MSILARILAVGTGATLSAGVAGAQFQPIDYAHHWQPNAEIVSVAFSGPALFSVAGAPNFAGPGDAIRRCYDEAQTQGGRNQSAGVFESTTYQVAQGFAQGGPGVDIGLVSVQAGSESDLGGDVCFSPFFASVGNTGGHKLGAAAVAGLITGTGPYPFPYVFDVVFQWAGTTTAAPSFQGVGNRATDGTSGASAGVPNPLLVNVIYEIQGPLTGGPLNNQYFLGSTSEVTGLGGGSTALGLPASSATGGVTNGNSAWGSSLFGVDAAVSGAVSHSRVFATTPLGLVGFIPRPLGGHAPLELVGFVGFQTPGLWAINDGNEGAGGPDWRISTSPVSVVNLRAQDHLSGAQTNANLLFKAGGSGPPDPAFDATLVFNQPLFLFSTTPAATMQQSPFSWDDLGGAAAAQPGSILLGPQPTRREGPQTVPITFDAITAAFLDCTNLTLGQQYIGSDDAFAVGGLFGTLSGTTSYFEGAFDNGYAVASPSFPSNQNIVSGTSRFGGPGLGDVPVAGQAKPAAAGVRLGVVAVGVQVRSTSPTIALTELSNALTIVLQ